MPGVDYKTVQSRVPMARVVELLGFVARGVTGDQLRGPCPVHRSQSPRSRSFSVHLARCIWFGRCAAVSSAVLPGTRSNSGPR